MYLKRLEIQGFKSFAQKAVLDFEKGISAIVGPNGSGKSNVADALKFVLGEQGMRNIRAKKSEDLIFSGSQSKSRLNMAQTVLYFDNSDKIFPIDSAEVSIGRKIFRDGENQYFINNAQIRLKDLAEFIAKAHLGLKGYAIVSQGMADHILSSSYKERKEIIDEALGLKEFQLKKNDSISKLNQTKNNLEKAESILRELAPHLKFLTRQVEKLEEKTQLEKKLTQLEKKFIEGKLKAAKILWKDVSDRKAILSVSQERLKKEISEVSATLEEEEKKISGFFSELENLEKNLFSLEQKKSSIERELGKVEGALYFKAKSKNIETQVFTPVDLSYVKSNLSAIKSALKEMSQAVSFEDIVKKSGEVSLLLDKLLFDIDAGRIAKKDEPKNENSEETDDLMAQKEKYSSLLKEINEEFLKVKNRIRQINLDHHSEKERMFNLRNQKREKESAYERNREIIIGIEREIDRLNLEIDFLNKEADSLKMESADILSGGALDISVSENLSEVSREVDRIKIKLETAEMIDESIVKEYEETKNRYDFLNKEVVDLGAAIISLNATSKKLEAQIEERFEKSFDAINKNFDKYFKVLFGGGFGKIEMVKESSLNEDGANAGSEERNAGETIQGIDVIVSLPGKKISSLSVLSGGERALCSLAFLFSLVASSPPPFLVLDEVDAALDEANSRRLAQILEELKKKTQFIVITHNRETMHQADVLYGVTMQEDGISKLLSLKFSEAEKLII